MPPTAQLLYVHLGMNADDDGFCEHFPIMRMVEAKPDDLKILSAKGFVQVFDDQVLIVTDWKENNYIQKDRYTPSKYLEVYKEEIQLLSSGKRIQDVYRTDTQVRLGKGSIGKDTNTAESKDSVKEKPRFNPLGAEIIKAFEEINPACKKFYNNTTQRNACDFLIETYTLEKTLSIVTKVLPKTNGQDFFPTITTPLKLQDKWADLEAAVGRHNSKNKAARDKSGPVFL